MAEKKSTFFAIHNSQMEQTRIKWAQVLSFVDDVIDHTPKWSDEGSEEPLKFTELWLSRIHEMHKFNDLLNGMKKDLWKEVEMLEYKIKVEKVYPIKAWEDFNQALDNTLVKLTLGAVEGNGRMLKRKRVYAADKNDLAKDGWFCV
ncbi:hypothetical protein CTI12_AA534380 [Artemisia annua]|uniref:Uncharacterized protein n=1 Tax=Artemisia annua TaxID=35608 RepID=A0A2U1L3F7_ARTAN|nr:hypothetical protein CTI12_AA534380 [Artemisia annua]